MSASVLVEYYGHACFRLTFGEQRVVLDPFQDGSVPGLPDIRPEAEFVFCSHGHHDHNAVETVRLTAKCEPCFEMTELPTEHDDAGGTKRGKNTVRIFSYEGIRVAHLGDLGRALLPKETELLRDVDLLLIPVGGFFTIDAETAAGVIRSVHPRVCVPMHYRTDKSGYDVIAHIDSFRALFLEAQDCASALELTPELNDKILIMKSKG